MDAKEFLGQFGKDLEKMKADTKGMVGAFGNLFGKTMGEGVLTVKQKELIALGIAVAKQCEPCIILHVKKCLDAGEFHPSINPIEKNIHIITIFHFHISTFK